MGMPFLGCAPMPSPLLSRPHTNALITSLHLYSSAAVHVNFSAEPVPMPTHHNPHPHPSFEIIGGARDLFLPVLGNLARPYDPFPLVGLNRHVETIFAAFCRSVPDVKFRRECLRTKDDGAVALDWISGDDRLLPADSPVLILLPGLTGGSEDAYVRHMLIRARNKGWRVVVFNSRGCGDSPVTTPQNPPAMQSTRTRYSLLYLILQFHSPGQTVMVQYDLHLIFYSASFLGDLHEVVSHVTTRYPEANIYAVGWSLGANILVRYLGQESHACPLSGAVSLCNPFNLVLADEDFHKGFNIVYDKALAKALSRIFKKHALLFEDMGGEYNIQLAVNAKSVREFDDGLTRVSFGFKSVDEYYSISSSSDSIKHVQIPLLCIQAANDPIAPSRGIPREDIRENPNCLLIVTPKGGHLGWVAGDEAPLGSPWTDPLVIDFLQHLERGAIKSATACSNPEGDHRSERALHNLEV